MENKEIGINYPKRISGLVSLALLLLFFGALIRISSEDNWSRINWQRFWVYATVTGSGGVGFLIYAIYPKASGDDNLDKIVKIKDIPVYTNNGYMYERSGGLVYVKTSETTHQQMQKNPNSGAWVLCGREEGFDPEEVVLRLSIP